MKDLAAQIVVFGIPTISNEANGQWYNVVTFGRKEIFCETSFTAETLASLLFDDAEATFSQ